MNLTLRIILIIGILLFFALIVRYLVKKKLNLKYTLAWLFAGIVMLVCVIFPSLVEKFGILIGVQSPVSTVFLLSIFFILIIVLTLTAIVSHMNLRIYRLTQMQAILEKRVRELEEKSENKEDK